MAEINWGLAQMPDIGGNALAAFEHGRMQAKQERSQNALLQIMRPKAPGQAPAQTPGIGDGVNPQQADPWGQLVPDDLAKAQQYQQRALQTEATQREQHQAQVQQMGRLLNYAQDEASYQQALGAARQLGWDLSGVPQNYDPSWVQQQKIALSAFEKDGGQQLTSTMKELAALGYKPGTPEFQQALAQTMNAGYAKPYTDGTGVQRLYTPQIAVPAQQPQHQPPPLAPQAQALTFDQFKAYADVQGPAKAAQWAAQNGLVISVRTPQEAESLPSGTRITLPDGSEGVVP